MQSVELGSQSVACQPLKLPQERQAWPRRLHDLLNLLHIQDLSPTDLILLLRSGLHDLVMHGANQWNLAQPWKDQGFQKWQLGCRHGQREMTLVLVATNPNHHLLLAQLERLCWDPWCISGRVHVVLICDQRSRPSDLSEALQRALWLVQMSIDLIVPDDQFGLFDCINLGVYLTMTDIVILDPSCLILRLHDVMQCMRGPSLLEPRHLVVPRLDERFGQACPPMSFHRDCFFDRGALYEWALGEMFVFEQLSSSFELEEKQGVRHVDGLPIKALRIPSQEDNVAAQASPLESWHDAFKHLRTVS